MHRDRDVAADAGHGADNDAQRQDHYSLLPERDGQAESLEFFHQDVERLRNPRSGRLSPFTMAS